MGLPGFGSLIKPPASQRYGTTSLGHCQKCLVVLGTGMIPLRVLRGLVDLFKGLHASPLKGSDREFFGRDLAHLPYFEGSFYMDMFKAFITSCLEGSYPEV